MRYASNKAFSTPPVKFRYAFPKQTPEDGENVELPRISTPVTVNERKGFTNKRNESRYHIGERENVLSSHHSKSYTGNTRNKLKSEWIDVNSDKTHDLESQASTYYQTVKTINQEQKQNSKGLSINYTHRQQKTYESLKNRYDSLVSERDHSTGRYKRSSFKPTGEIIFGIYPVLLALNAERRKLHCLFYKKGSEGRSERIREILDIGLKQNIKIYGLDIAQFKKLLRGDEVHQGICCDASRLPFEELQDEHFSQFIKPISDSVNVNSTKEDDSLECQPGIMALENREKPHQLWLYLDQIHDPMNFGAVLRSAYFMGVDKVLTSESHRLEFLEFAVDKLILCL